MIYIDYLGQHGAFTSTLEGDDWKITSVTEHQISQEKFEYSSLLTTMTHLIYTVEITNEFGKSIKFDVDSGVTINGTNPNSDSPSYYLYNESKELNYVHLKIGSNKRLVIIRSADENGKAGLDNNLTNFLKKEMKFVRDYFEKAETVDLKKKDIEKDFVK
ncbi:MAG: hypothetical protein J6T74_03030 [Clostridia bacterium]|nr:hypothetical protein [Clostridia bacterium]